MSRSSNEHRAIPISRAGSTDGPQQVWAQFVDHAGNVSVAVLDQSKFIPAASGLIGVELDKSFQIGAGVNLLPDPVAPSHAIFAFGWTPKVGSIQTPIHFFFIPDHGDPATAPGMTNPRNWRTGATIGLNW